MVGTNVRKAGGNAIIAIGSVSTVLLALIGLIACYTPPPAPKAANKVSLLSYALRGVAAFLAIATAVFLSRINDVAAGFSSTFPAIFLSTMVALWLSQGEGVPTGATGPMVLGSTSVAGYAVIFAACMANDWSPYAAAFVSWLGAVSCASVPSSLYLRWRRSVIAAKAPPSVDAVSASSQEGVSTAASVQGAGTSTASSGSPVDTVTSFAAQPGSHPSSKTSPEDDRLHLAASSSTPDSVAAGWDTLQPAGIRVDVAPTTAYR